MHIPTIPTSCDCQYRFWKIKFKLGHVSQKCVIWPGAHHEIWRSAYAHATPLECLRPKTGLVEMGAGHVGVYLLWQSYSFVYWLQTRNHSTTGTNLERGELVGWRCGHCQRLCRSMKFRVVRSLVPRSCCTVAKPEHWKACWNGDCIPLIVCHFADYLNTGGRNICPMIWGAGRSCCDKSSA